MTVRACASRPAGANGDFVSDLIRMNARGVADVRGAMCGGAHALVRGSRWQGSRAVANRRRGASGALSPASRNVSALKRPGVSRRIADATWVRPGAGRLAAGAPAHRGIDPLSIRILPVGFAIRPAAVVALSPAARPQPVAGAARTKAELPDIVNVLLEALSPYRGDHINRLGSYLLDLQRKVPPLDPTIDFDFAFKSAA
ncbi:UNVERIFIED_ORG: hypothetical protein ABIC48_001597 [Burkholderia territorii]